MIHTLTISIQLRIYYMHSTQYKTTWQPISSINLWCGVISIHLFHIHGYTETDVHDDVIKWKHFLSYWLFVRGIHWSPVNSPHKGQWSSALMFSLICAWINHQGTSDLRCSHAHYGVTVMYHWTALSPSELLKAQTHWIQLSFSHSL